MFCYLLTVLISISSGIDNHSASIQVHICCTHDLSHRRMGAIIFTVWWAGLELVVAWSHSLLENVFGKKCQPDKGIKVSRAAVSLASQSTNMWSLWWVIHFRGEEGGSKRSPLDYSFLSETFRQRELKLAFVSHWFSCFYLLYGCLAISTEFNFCFRLSAVLRTIYTCAHKEHCFLALPGELVPETNSGVNVTSFQSGFLWNWVTKPRMYVFIGWVSLCNPRSSSSHILSVVSQLVKVNLCSTSYRVLYEALNY